MLAIRLQRTGRSGHAQYRMVVQDSRRTPTSGKIVTALGSYNPHAKTLILDKEKATTFLNNGAQPSPRVAVLLAGEGIKMPTWVKTPTKKDRTTKRPDQLRSNRPADAPAPVKEAEPVSEEAPAETTTEEVAPEAIEETASEEVAEPSAETATPEASEAQSSTDKSGAVAEK